MLVEQTHIKGPVSHLYDTKILILNLKAIVFTAGKQSNIA